MKPLLLIDTGNPLPMILDCLVKLSAQPLPHEADILMLNFSFVCCFACNCKFTDFEEWDETFTVDFEKLYSSSLFLRSVDADKVIESEF